MVDLVTESLELCAETGEDITPAVYEKYFAACPGSEALMSHIDDLVRAKMMAEVYRLIMLPNFNDEEGYLNFEVNNHALAYSVEPHMYNTLLYALSDTVAETMGDNWNQTYASAWEDRIDALTVEISSRVKQLANQHA